MAYQEASIGEINCESIVSRIVAGDRIGEEMLFGAFHRGLRFLALRMDAANADDHVQNTFIEAISQIRENKLIEPRALPGYLRTILRRQIFAGQRTHSRLQEVSGGIEHWEAVKADTRPNPHQSVELQEQADLLRSALRKLKPREREILSRFYLDEQSAHAICGEMNLTETQFRLLKSRSKQKLERFRSERAALTHQSQVATLASTQSAAAPKVFFAR